MPHIALVTASPDNYDDFISLFSSEPDVIFEVLTSMQEALVLARTGTPHLIIMDGSLPRGDPFNSIKEIIAVNAMVNTAVISSLSEEDFHEKGEGLGILCRIPPNPGEHDAQMLLQKLRGVMGFQNCPGAGRAEPGMLLQEREYRLFRENT